MKSIRQQINNIAWPSIISNLTIPLLALTDTTIAGHLGAVSLGAIAVGGTLFSILYNVFNFLRMGTGGFTSQAYGAHHYRETFRILVRALCSGVLIGMVLWGARGWLSTLLFSLMGASPDVSAVAHTYFSILIYGAPAVLATYTFSGWFLGMQDARTPLLVAVVQNIVNIAVSLTCVYVFHRGTAGVAVGTLVAQYSGLCLYLWRWWRRYRHTYRKVDVVCAMRHGKKRFFTVNRDIFLRTLCITSVHAAFTSMGAHSGTLTLAANALLLQFFVLLSYFMDGLAYAGEALGGKYYGKRDVVQFSHLTQVLLKYGYGLAVVFTLVYALGGSTALQLLTADAAIRTEALRYLPYVVLLPLCGTASFLLDGLFAGCTATRPMLLSMFVSALVFALVVGVMRPWIGNHGLWCGLLAFLAARGMVLGVILYRRLQSGEYVLGQSA